MRSGLLVMPAIAAGARAVVSAAAANSLQSEWVMASSFERLVNRSAIVGPLKSVLGINNLLAYPVRMSNVSTIVGVGADTAALHIQ